MSVESIIHRDFDIIKDYKVETPAHHPRGVKLIGVAEAGPVYCIPVTATAPLHNVEIPEFLD